MQKINILSLNKIDNYLYNYFKILSKIYLILQNKL